jgi:hypothetical protein
MKNLPNYHLSLIFIAQLFRSIFTEKIRSFHNDSENIVAKMGTQVVIHNNKLMPRAGPGLLVFNHYSREGFSILFAAAAIAATIPFEMHWVMTGAWTFPGRPFSRQLRNLSEWLFRRIAQVYGFTLTPPMPPAPADQEARAEAIRRVFQRIKANPSTLVALAPEGRDFPGGVLGMPPTGSGKFLLELSRRLEMVYPVGIFEEGGALHLCFGAPFDLYSIIKGSTLEPGEASRIVMERIASLLPGYLAGEFHNQKVTREPGNSV